LADGHGRALALHGKMQQRKRTDHRRHCGNHPPKSPCRLRIRAVSLVAIFHLNLLIENRRSSCFKIADVRQSRDCL
jgi:hypothetical protein